ncbi:uncharacterized protein K02A2.6-like [Trichogramma pretiosum]|uniref:uncharacterized protein K02A2.6-like n=1 Tax=Trichogramma pretiosum TaxID=7493 RepID=UPI0006C93EAF|nr:uncharacterized protein K02A2.6-like [Trichogramma pretiosum]
MTFLFNNTYFKFNNTFYRHLYGTLMGSCISSLTADLAMDDLEKWCLKELKKQKNQSASHPGLSKAEQRYAVIHKEALAIYWSCKKFYQYLRGRHFELYCDRKPLMAILGEKRDIPQMIAGQLQRWACFLSGFDYTFNYVKGKDNGGADGLSRLPITSQESEEPEIDYVRFIIEDKLPVDHAQIKKATRTDPILSKVFMYTRDGWPESIDDALKPYFHHLSELSINQDLLIWGYRVLIPKKHRLRTLEELHSMHLGASKMKAMARQYFWWPKLDTDIEQYAKSYDVCNTYAPNPNKAELFK